jgi:hypothetical protein
MADLPVLILAMVHPKSVPIPSELINRLTKREYNEGFPEVYSLPIGKA